MRISALLLGSWRRSDGHLWLRELQSGGKSSVASLHVRLSHCCTMRREDEEAQPLQSTTDRPSAAHPTSNGNNAAGDRLSAVEYGSVAAAVENAHCSAGDHVANGNSSHRDDSGGERGLSHEDVHFDGRRADDTSTFKSSREAALLIE